MTKQETLPKGVGVQNLPVPKHPDINSFMCKGIITSILD